jgi:hypothetical protein
LEVNRLDATRTNEGATAAGVSRRAARKLVVFLWIERLQGASNGKGEKR